MAGITVLYASVGPRMLQYRVDVATGTLEQFAELKLPDIVQYAWANSSEPICTPPAAMAHRRRPRPEAITAWWSCASIPRPGR